MRANRTLQIIIALMLSMQSAIAVHAVEHDFDFAQHHDNELCVTYQSADNIGALEASSYTLLNHRSNSYCSLARQSWFVGKRYLAFASRAPPVA